jgi:hypothetical protein
MRGIPTDEGGLVRSYRSNQMGEFINLSWRKRPFGGAEKFTVEFR